MKITLELTFEQFKQFAVDLNEKYPPQVVGSPFRGEPSVPPDVSRFSIDPARPMFAFDLPHEPEMRETSIYDYIANQDDFTEWERGSMRRRLKGEANLAEEVVKYLKATTIQVPQFNTRSTLRIVGVEGIPSA